MIFTMENEFEVEKSKIQVLHLLVKNVHFCIDINNIAQIVQLSRVEIVPNSPSYLAGLMNFAGKSIPLIDLSIRLGFKNTTPYALDTPVLLCSVDNQKACMIIDKIIGLSDIEPEALQMYEEFKTADSPFSAAVILDTGISLLIDIKRVLEFSLTLRTNDFCLNTDLTHLSKNRAE